MGGLDPEIAKDLNLNGTQLKVCDERARLRDCENVNNCKLSRVGLVQKSDQSSSASGGYQGFLCLIVLFFL